MGDELLDMNCSRCGTPFRVRIADIGEGRFVECEPCASRAPFNKRSVFVVFEQRTDPQAATEEST
jgi:DNA-directed RNA polymerase subunit RPC12/RpoP